MSPTLRFLHHPTSQPCRAVHQLMLETGIEHEEQIINLIEGENEDQAFKDAYNPTGQVPILCDGDFVVWESAAIAFYLNEKFNLPANWFGADIRQRALVQQYLHWHSCCLRRGAGAFFYTHFASCIWGERDFSREIALGRHRLFESMDILEQWLSRTPYLCGDEVSFADLMGYHELVSHEAGAIISPDEWRRYPAVRGWFDRLCEREHAQAVSQMIMMVGAMRQAGKPMPMNRRTSLAKGTEITPEGFDEEHIAARA
jgi:glutathione S-transferase